MRLKTIAKISSQHAECWGRSCRKCAVLAQVEGPGVFGGLSRDPPLSFSLFSRLAHFKVVNALGQPDLPQIFFTSPINLFMSQSEFRLARAGTGPGTGPGTGGYVPGRLPQTLKIFGFSSWLLFILLSLYLSSVLTLLRYFLFWFSNPLLFLLFFSTFS